MKELIITYGVPGSGKDYWAEQLMKKHPGKYKRINKDCLREMMDLSEYSFENEKLILDVRDTLVKKFLTRGYSVIVSDTNFPFEGKHFKRLCEIAKSVGDVKVIQKFMDVPIKECKERNSNRTRIVPEHIIDNMYNKHVVNKSCDFRSVYFEPVVVDYSIKNNKQKAIIVDMDGTLAIMNGRGAYDYDAVLNDIPNEKLIYLINSYIQYNTDTKLIVVSGRDDISMEDTQTWLEINGVYPDLVLMRTTGDKRKDSIIKKELYDKYIKDNYNVIYVFDDRNQVVETWRNMGLFCLQVQDGDF